jgi:YYY domain-containing protein
MSPLLSWWILLEGLGLLALPLLFRLFGPAMAHGYPFAKIFAALVITYVSWLAAHVLPLPLALYLAIAALVAASLASLLRDRAVLTWLRNGGIAEMLRHDALFTAGFLFFAFQRSMVPDIFGAEKYMDFAFLNSLATTASMPPPDPWMSGKVINYYYFGYLMFADLARLVPQPTFITYNLCVATLGGLAFSQTCAVVLALTRRWGIALLGGAMSALLGNLDGFLQLIEKGTLRGMDIWRASRVVQRGDTINEFPFFSIVHGDLHPHFIVLPVAILLLAALLDERLFPSRAADQPQSLFGSIVPYAFVAFLLGCSVAISTWELPAAALALALLAGRWQPLSPLFSRDRLLLAARVVAVVVVAYLLFLPFYRSFAAPPSTPAFRLATTSLGQFLTVFGLLLFAPALLVGNRAWKLMPGGGEWRHLGAAASVFALLIALVAGNAVLPLLAAFLAATLLVAYRGAEDSERAGYLLVATALITLLACEVVYLRDSYGERLYRMNTVFKLYFQSWTMLAIASPWCFDRLLRSDSASALGAVARSGLAMLIGAAACVPIGVTWDRMLWPIQRTLDGNAYLARDHRDDYAAIVWLRENVPPGQVILEATGNPYSYFARFASNTGLPTPLGWANHEGLWRAHDASVGTRKSEVDWIYNAPSLDAVDPRTRRSATQILDELGVRYVIVGDLERENHAGPGLEKFNAYPVVFRSGQTVVYERRSPG